MPPPNKKIVNSWVVIKTCPLSLYAYSGHGCTYQVLNGLDAAADAPDVVQPHHPVLHVEQGVGPAQRLLRLRVLHVTLPEKIKLKF